MCSNILWWGAVRHVMAVPIAFTSDHVETLFEIDIEYAEEAHEAGITVRLPPAWKIENAAYTCMVIYLSYSISRVVRH
jgi:protoheme ferro-lyase